MQGLNNVQQVRSYNNYWIRIQKTHKIIIAIIKTDKNKKQMKALLQLCFARAYWSSFILFGVILVANGINIYSQSNEINNRLRIGIHLCKHRVWCFACILVYLMPVFQRKSEKFLSWVNFAMSMQTITKALSAKLIWLIYYSVPDTQNPDSLCTT